MAEGQIVVTGASKGIGAAIAAELDRRGLSVVCLSRSGESAVRRAMSCDMTDEDAVKDVFAEIAGRGTIAGLVNNAGVHIGGSIATLSTEDFNRTIVVEHHSGHGGGEGSLSAPDACPAAGDRQYRVVLRQAGRSRQSCLLRLEGSGGGHDALHGRRMGRGGIRVMNVAPGYIETDLNRDFLAREKVRAWMKQRIPTGAPGTAAEVARLVAALLCEQIGFLTGETIYIDGGQGMNH